MHGKTRYTPLTVEERQFAEDNHQIVFKYLRSRKLDPDEYYDVVIFRYLLSVKKMVPETGAPQMEVRNNCLEGHGVCGLEPPG